MTGETEIIHQEMNWIDPETKTEQRKGMKSILEERRRCMEGLDGKLKVGKCALCKIEASRVFRGEADPARVDCCFQRMLSLEPDFLAQKCQLEEVHIFSWLCGQPYVLACLCDCVLCVVLLSCSVLHLYYYVDMIVSSSPVVDIKCSSTQNSTAN